jgi:hypothetical protein
MMALLHNAGGEGAYPFSRKEREMPNLILSAVARLHKPGPPRAGDTHAVRHAATRTRDATRRLRASTLHDPYVYLGPLDLTRTRH